jgi:hypothetical protein
MRQLIDDSTRYDRRREDWEEPLPHPAKGKAQTPRKPRPQRSALTDRTILAEFHHVYRSIGIPVEYWDREDMVILQALAKPLRQMCWEKWLIRPAIVEGDTVRDAIAKVQRLKR